MVDHCEVVTYAHDTSLRFEVDPHGLLDEFEGISSEKDEVIGCFQKFALIVNESKTNTVLFRVSQAQIEVPTIRLGG